MRRLVVIGLLAVLVTAARPARAEVRRDQVMAALPALARMAQGVIDHGGVPGLSIAVVFHDEVVYLAGFGVREAGRPERVDADTVFQIASCSKPIASTVVAALVGNGTLSWDSRIADIDPAFQLPEAYPSQQVTVADLFSHRSGLPGNAGNDLEGIGYERADILHRLRLVAPSSSFRAGYSYSNFGLTEGAVAAARAAGKTWEDLSEDVLYRPLGMTATSSRHRDFVARTNRAALHVPVDGTWQAKLTRDPDAEAPAGGVSSSARDLAQWMRLELANGRFEGRQLIKADALAHTHEPMMSLGPNSVTGRPAFYGLGWNIEYAPQGVRWGHAGAFSTGARSVVRLVPDADLGIMVLANAFPSGAPDALADSFLDDVLVGHATQDWLAAWDKAYQSLFAGAGAAARAQFASPPASATAALPASAYGGTYANAYVGTATVAEQDGALELTLGPNGAIHYPLRHFDRDVFTYVPSPELPDLAVAAIFQLGPDGHARQVTLDSMNSVGQGVLTRVP